jgi:tRNA dimethylallyltransferase
LIDLVVIAGPTASGKTRLSLKLAEYFDIEIISADSRQVYKYLDIGTAKPEPDELRKVPHHFISILEPDDYYSAGKFGEEAREKIREIKSRDKIPVAAGGSGLYIKALCEGLFSEEEPENNAEIRENLNIKLIESGRESLFDELKKIDPASADNYPDKNPVRIIRALEYFHSTGKLFSEAKLETPGHSLNYKIFYIDFPRETLYDRINRRTEEMWERGLEEETRKVLNMGYSPELNSLNTVGYKECISYFAGDFTRQQAIEKMKQNTRRYAKRQTTWFRKQQDLIRLEPGDNWESKFLNLFEELIKAK